MKKRDYKQNCSLALASDFLGERWTMLIFRELLIQPCRFKQLNTWLDGIGTNLLTQRLKELESASLISKQMPNDRRSAYCLSEKGKSVEPVILSMIRWGYFNLDAGDDYQHFHHWDLLAMKALFNPNHCKKTMTVQFIADSLIAWVKVSRSGLSFAIGEAAKPDIVLSITISQLHQGNAEKLLNHYPLLIDFIGCFDTSLLNYQASRSLTST